MSRCTAWTHDWSPVMSRCTACLTRQHGRPIAADVPVRCLNPRLIAGDHDLSEVKQMRSEDGYLCTVSLFSGIVSLCETVTSAVAVLLWFMPLCQTVQTQYAVRRNTLILYSAVLRVSAHQNHHQAPLLQQFKNESTFATCKCAFVSEISQIYDYLLQLFITFLVSCL